MMAGLILGAALFICVAISFTLTARFAKKLTATRWALERSQADAKRCSAAMVIIADDLKGCQIQRDELQRQIALFRAQCQAYQGFWFRPDGAQLHITSWDLEWTALCDWKPEVLRQLPTDGRTH